MLRLPITYEFSAQMIADDDSVIYIDSPQSLNDQDESVICLDSSHSFDDQDESVICLDSSHSFDVQDESIICINSPQISQPPHSKEDDVICLDSIQPSAYSSSTPAPGSPEFSPSNQLAEWLYLERSDPWIHSSKTSFLPSPSSMLSYCSPQSTFNSTESHQLVDSFGSPKLAMVCPWFDETESPQTPQLPQWPLWPQSPQTLQLLQSPQSPQWSPLHVTHPYENTASTMNSTQSNDRDYSAENVSINSNICNWSPSATYVVFTIGDYNFDGSLIESPPSKRFKKN